MAYVTNRPQANELLSDSQEMLKDNFNALDTLYGLDHYAYSNGSAQAGQHNVIQQYQSNRTRTGVGAITANFPANVAQTQKLFSAAYTPDSTVTSADTQLFALTGNGGVSQLTGNSTADTNDGWAWIGGILVQWGWVNSVAASGSVTFKDRVVGAIPFPNTCFKVFTTITYNNTGGTGFVISIQNQAAMSPLSTGFNWTRGGNATSGTFSGFFWLAIGN